MSGRGSDGWETVHTVNDFHDGPRGGVADYRGIPHAYRCLWNNEADDWGDVFNLSPIGAAQFRDVEENWQIWRRWKVAHDAGQLAEGDHHPALAAERGRHNELQKSVLEALRVDEDHAIRATPEFRGTMEPVHALQVRWSSA